MKKQLKIDDLGELSLELKSCLVTHGVPEELHYSILSDALFAFASLLDEKTGTDFHERLLPLLDDYLQKPSQSQIGDYLVAEIAIVFQEGRKAEMNVLYSHLENSTHLQFDLEMALALRNLDEIGDEIDVGTRFAKLMQERKGIESLKILAADNCETDSWRTVPLKSEEHGEYEQSVDGLAKCIRKVVSQCL